MGKVYIYLNKSSEEKVNNFFTCYEEKVKNHLPNIFHAYVIVFFMNVLFYQILKIVGVNEMRKRYHNKKYVIFAL